MPLLPCYRCRPPTHVTAAAARPQHNCLPPGYLERLGSELRSLPASTRHVVVMLAGPILYPSLPVQATLQVGRVGAWAGGC